MQNSKKRNLISFNLKKKRREFASRRKRYQERLRSQMDYLPQMTGQHSSPLSTKGSLMTFIVYAHTASLCALLCVLVCIFVSLYLAKRKINCGCRNALKAFKPLEISCFLTLFYTNTLASTSCIHSHSHSQPCQHFIHILPRTTNALRCPETIIPRHVFDHGNRLTSYQN